MAAIGIPTIANSGTTEAMPATANHGCPQKQTTIDAILDGDGEEETTVMTCTPR